MANRGMQFIGEFRRRRAFQIGLVVALLLASAALFLPAMAHAQSNRLEVWENRNGDLYRKWSDDGGYNWSGSVPVGIWAHFACAELIYQGRDNFRVIGNPAIVSDQAGRFMVVVKTAAGAPTFTTCCLSLPPACAKANFTT